jgi:hypothetical protein
MSFHIDHPSFELSQICGPTIMMSPTSVTGEARGDPKGRATSIDQLTTEKILGKLDEISRSQKLTIHHSVSLPDFCFGNAAFAETVPSADQSELRDLRCPNGQPIAHSTNRHRLQLSLTRPWSTEVSLTFSSQSPHREPAIDSAQ